MIASMLPVDMALLQSEWAGRTSTGRARCPSCEHLHEDGQHGPNCPHDVSLAERGYPDQPSRELARMRLAQSHLETIPPPEPT